MIKIKNRFTGELLMTMDRETLQDANLKGANLKGANFDFSCLPICCGGQGAKIDDRQARQIVAHALAYDCESEWYRWARNLLRVACGHSRIASHLDWLKGEK